MLITQMNLSLVEFRKLNASLDWRVTADDKRVAKASEVCRFLGWEEASAYRKIQRVFPEYRFQSSFGKAYKPSWYLYEAGVLQLYFLSGTPAAIMLQRFLFQSLPDFLWDENIRLAGMTTTSTRSDEDVS